LAFDREIKKRMRDLLRGLNWAGRSMPHDCAKRSTIHWRTAMTDTLKYEDQAIHSDLDVPAPALNVLARQALLAPTSAGAGMLQALLGRLLVMAQRYRREGNNRQAAEMFWTLVHDHAETPEAETAKAELLALAESHERAGDQHMARSMYERLMDLED
jgi:hypothetical protein